MKHSRFLHLIRQIRPQYFLIVVGLVLVVTIVWIDIQTSLWQEVVILSGLASGLVTFVLTVAIIDKLLARSAERRWAPVTRLALTDILHALADTERSEISRGLIEPRKIEPLDHPLTPADLENLRHRLLDERHALTMALAVWVQFLTSNSSSQPIMRHVANVALELEKIRDAALSYERRLAQSAADLAPALMSGVAEPTLPEAPAVHGLEPEHDVLQQAIQRCNTHMLTLVTEIKQQLEREAALSAARAPR